MKNLLNNSIIKLTLLLSFTLLFSTHAYSGQISGQENPTIKSRPGSCDGERMCRLWRRYAQFLEQSVNYVKGHEYEQDVENGCLSYVTSTGNQITRGVVNQGTGEEVTCSRKIGLRNQIPGEADYFSIRKTENRATGVTSYSQGPRQLMIDLGNNTYMDGAFDIFVDGEKIRFIADVSVTSLYAYIDFYKDGRPYKVHAIKSIIKGQEVDIQTPNFTQDQVDAMKRFADKVINLFR